MSTFLRSLVRFSLSKRVSKNWLRAVIEMVRLECDHDPAQVTADILEGDGKHPVMQCRLCGSTKTAYGFDWEAP